LLAKKGWVEEGEETELIGQLWKKRKKYRLVTSTINAAAREYVAKSKKTDFSGSGGPGNRVPETEKSGLNKETTFISSTTTTTTDTDCGGSGNDEKPTPTTPTPDQQKGEDVKQSQGNGLEDLEIEPCLANYLPTLSLPSSMPLETRQQILDELAGAVRARSIKKSPAAFLRGLITRQEKGAFQPDLGHQVAANRAKQAAHEATMAATRAAGPGERSQAVEQPRPRQHRDVMGFVAAAGVSLVKSTRPRNW